MVVYLAEALEALHGAAHLHGDIKPSNIGFTANGLAEAARLRSAQSGSPVPGPALDDIAKPPGHPRPNDTSRRNDERGSGNGVAAAPLAPRLDDRFTTLEIEK